MGEFRGTERFEVRRRLGAGGMGVVYEAFDRERGGSVALKTMHSLNPDALYRFKTEFRVLQGLQHRNLVRLDELFVGDRDAYFTMEYVAGVSLVDFVRAQALTAFETADTARVPAVPFDERRLRSAAGQLCAALRALHDAGHVHRDIKPANVLVDGDGRVVLLDFGLVACADPGLQSTGGHVVGTAAYMAPEQALAGTVGPAADWYSFGVVLFEAMTGRLPFAGSPAEILVDKQSKDAPRARELVPSVPAELDELCARLLARDPGRRPGPREVVAAVSEGDAEVPDPRSSGQTMSAPFVGRVAELDALRDALVRTREGATALVLVRGESGVGKSELVRSFVARARSDEPDLVVLAGRCYERESVPYKAFDGVADAIGRYMTRLAAADAAALLPVNAYLLPRLFPVLQRVPAIANAPAPAREIDDPREVRARMFGAFRELLVRLARTRATVVVIDDYQWADADSTALLRDVTALPESPNLVLVATIRADAPVPVLDNATWQVIELDNLDAVEAQELVRLLAPDLASQEMARRIVSESHGHPLFIQELARSTTAAAGLRLEDAIAARVAELPEAARAVLELLAVAGEPVSLGVAASCLGCERSDVAGALQALRVASLARRAGERTPDHFECYHDRIRAAVREGVPEDQRRALYVALAEALERAGEAPERILRALRAAGERLRAATHAELAARRALRAHAFERAAEMFLAALEDGDWEPVRARELRRAAGTALMNAGQGARAAEQLLLAAEGAPTNERTECFRLAAEMLLTTGNIHAGMQSLEELLAEIGVAFPATSRRALLSMVWDRAVLRMRGLRWKERDEDDLPHSVLREIDIYKTVAHGLSMVDSVRGMSFQARALRLALKAGEPSRAAMALAREAAFSAVRGARVIPRSEALIARAKAIAARLADPYIGWFVRGCQATVWYFGGRYSDAERAILELDAEGLELPRGAWWELSSLRLFRCISLMRLGRFAELAEVARGAIRDAQRRSDQHTAAIVGRCAHLGWLAVEGADGARRRIDDARWHPLTTGYHLHHWFSWRARAEISLFADDYDEAMQDFDTEYRGLQRSLLTHVQVVRADSRWLVGRLLVLKAMHSGDKRELSRARRIARAAARETGDLYSVEALLLRASVDTVGGRPEAAVGCLERASEIAATRNMLGYDAAARCARGALVGGAAGQELRDGGLDALRSLGVRDPIAMARLFVPGIPGLE